MNLKFCNKINLENLIIPACQFTGLLFFQDADIGSALILVSSLYISMAVMAYFSTKFLMALLRSCGAQDLASPVSFLACLSEPYFYLLSSMALVTFSLEDKSEPLK